MELGFIEKLIEMYKYRKILCELKQELEEKDGLSVGYIHVEGKFLVDQMLNFNSMYLRSIMTPRAKEIVENIQRIANKAKF
jgi:CBS domain containing-hemolysin-like protein